MFRIKSILSGALLLFSVVSFAEKSPLPYTVLKSSPDTSLGKTESLFAFTFYTPAVRILNGDIQMSHNGESLTAKTGSKGEFDLKLKPGKYLFRFFYTNSYYEIVTDSIQVSPGHKTEILVHFQQAEMPVISFKPVIYVYPKQSTEINITLDVKGKLDFTYPKYENGWKFTADPDGTIHLGGRKYDYLFWDGVMNIEPGRVNWNEGFIVKKENLTAFFEENLGLMGLSPREIQDYITYWCPLMQANESNYVHFLFNEDYNRCAALNVTPRPDSQFRVFMVWTDAAKVPTGKLQAQEIPTFNRTGFTLVEWGGTVLNSLPKTVQ
ncbi:MAG: hypothetical protein FD123_2174 [Bacteroidetes bacterium]|nr:MAG: hypothetical protein FD123_2174 [Bacteroidota bacterium]